ncbi:toll-like receptor 2 isoform X3 [Mustela putorius furo]|uniref:Toll-like receptor 2 n=1 Tax=Mustela putorius furo TaxID=9669 RepID=A0A8U0SA40_MUSPF|nr:toll-like receptor 2 isoform X3 [Mustela putorius furo]
MKIARSLQHVLLDPWTMSRVLWTVWVLGAITKLSKEEGPDQASSPSCDPMGVCDGRFRSLKSIPSGLTAAVRSLDLSNNEITYIRNRDLRGCVNLKALKLVSNGINAIEKDSFISLQSLEHLDLSYNLLSNLSSSWFRPLSSLKFLNLLGNLYKSLGETPLFSQLTNLQILKVGSIDRFTELQEKDFAGLTFLEELEIDASNLQRNKLKTLPDASFLPMLHVLRISRNTISTFTKEQLDSFSTLEALEAGSNNFLCSCEFLSFTREQQSLAQILTDWPDNYLCDSPFSVRGQRVKDTRLPASECHQVALVSAVCSVLFLLILLTGVLCHHFHGLWYLKMMWAWLQAKRKPRKAPPRDVCYDAFVSYSEHDSYWVENMMVQELEHFDPPFRLCLHKRDFIPGKWIIDNIIDSIEKSHKTIFVLSENFVKSEWCKYELDFSHFRLFDENNDAAILILLEPIEKKAIPQRFCKLRKIMNTKTYLEWPTDETQQEGFWLNLRTALKS